MSMSLNVYQRLFGCQIAVFFLENKSKIVEYMDETYEYRKYQIVNFLFTPTAIVTEFPRFLDVDFGRLITADNVHQYPKTSDIGTFMSKYGNRLIRLALYNNMEIQESTDAQQRETT